MLRATLRLSVLVLAVLALGPAATAVAAPDLPLEVSGIDTSRSPETSLTVLTPPEFGSARLAPTAFSLTEGGRKVPVQVTAKADGALDLVVLVDTSGSMTGAALESARAMATGLVQRVPAGGRAALISFGRSATLASPLSADAGAHAAAIAGLQPAGETALYDALLVGLDQFPPGPGRRAVVVVTDGGDTVSASPAEAVAAALARSRTPLFVVEIDTPESAGAALAALSTASGGTVVDSGPFAARLTVDAALAVPAAREYRLRYTSRSRGPVDLVVTVRANGIMATHTTRLDSGGSAAPASSSPTPTAGADSQATAPTAGRPWGVVLGAGAIFAALLILALALMLPGERRLRMATENWAAASSPARFSDLAGRASSIVERTLERRGRQGAMGTALENAGITLRPGELIVLAAASSLTALMLGAVMAGPLLGLVFAIAVAVGFKVRVDMMAAARRSRFADQLAGLVQELAGSLRAGYGLVQAIDSASLDAESPTADELRRIVAETRLGRSLQESLRAMADRMGSEDFQWVVQAIEIQRDVGGNLVEVLESVGGTIRSREHLRRQVRTLSAEGRISARILLALPFVIGGLLSLMNPGYIQELFYQPVGVALLVVGGVLMSVGYLWLRRIVRPVY